MRYMVFLFVFGLFLILSGAEKDRLAVMDVQDEDRIFSARSVVKVTDYIFAKFQETNSFWMVPMADRDNALEQAIEETVKGSRKECVDEKCQLSLVAQLQANYLINTKIKKLYEGTCNITVSKFDVEKRAGVQSWVEKFDCTEKGLYGAIDGFNFGGKRKGSSFQSGKIGETVEDWEVGAGEETIVKFDSEPSEAIVLVDGRIVCQKTPCSKMVTMGKHTVTIQKENYLPKEKVFDIKKGQSIKAELEPNFGWLTVSSPVDVDVILDGQKIGKTPINKMIINLGAHQIEHADGCYYQSGEKFQIKRGDNKEINLELNPKESAIKVTAQDNDGNDVEADVFVDGKNIGTAPGTFKIPMCSKEVIVKKEKNEFKQDLTLKEKKVLTVDAVLNPLDGEWSKKAPNTMNWNDAKEYCANLEEDGYSDWRLPTISELRTLIKNCPATETGGACKVTYGCLSSGCKDACSCFFAFDGRYSKLGDKGCFWSSSELSDGAAAAWNVGFESGNVGYSVKYFKNLVRCVRTNLQNYENSTTDAVPNPSDGNWSNRAPNTMNWNDAKKYCANLEEDGYSDWRLPTISELRTLIKNCPTIETGGACKVTDSCLSYDCQNDACNGCSYTSDGRYSKLGDTEVFWSSSRKSYNADNVWGVDFNDGLVNGYDKNNYGLHVRCVK